MNASSYVFSRLVVKTGTRRLESSKATFNWFLPEEFGQGNQSSSMGRVRWIMTLKMVILLDVCFRWHHLARYKAGMLPQITSWLSPHNNFMVWNGHFCETRYCLFSTYVSALSNILFWSQKIPLKQFFQNDKTLKLQTRYSNASGYWEEFKAASWILVPYLYSS